MSQPVHRYWKYTAVICGLLLVCVVISQYQISQSLKNTFYYHLRVKVVDAATGEPVKAGLSMPGTASGDYYPQTSDVVVEGEGVFGISGVGYTDRKWGFSAEGYADESLVISAASSQTGEMTIRLKKAPAR